MGHTLKWIFYQTYRESSVAMATVSLLINFNALHRTEKITSLNAVETSLDGLVHSLQLTCSPSAQSTQLCMCSMFHSNVAFGLRSVIYTCLDGCVWSQRKSTAICTEKCPNLSNEQLSQLGQISLHHTVKHLH